MFGKASVLIYLLFAFKTLFKESSAFLQNGLRKPRNDCRYDGNSRSPQSSSRLFHSNDNNRSNDDISRRRAVEKMISSSSASMLIRVEPSYSIETSTNPNLKCLLDLPPITENCVRIYLCRHGQTEFNRLRKVQGARVDPPINKTGRLQAIRLGETLSMLKQNGNDVDLHFPRIALHSTLQRARETATVVSLMIGKASYDENENAIYVDELLGSGSPIAIKDFKNTLDLQALDSLGEVDFGSVEGKSVNEAKAEMMVTWAKWSLGKIDATDGGDGESGRSVLQRVSLALNSLAEIAASNGGSAIAVTHSAYLRILLCLVLEIPLLEAASLEQKNCCINVIDVSLKERVKLTSKSDVFGGRLSMAPKEFNLEFPRVHVIRMNEISHLDGLL